MTQQARPQRRVGERAETHADVDALFGQRHHPVDELQAQVEVGVSAQELGHRRQDVQLAEEDRRGDRELAGERGVGAGARLEEVELGQHPARPVEVALPVVGE